MSWSFYTYDFIEPIYSIVYPFSCWRAHRLGLSLPLSSCFSRVFRFFFPLCFHSRSPGIRRHIVTPSYFIKHDAITPAPGRAVHIETRTQTPKYCPNGTHEAEEEGQMQGVIAVDSCGLEQKLTELPFFCVLRRVD